MNLEEKECPYCKELIKAKAIKCRYCGGILSNPQTTEFTQQGKSKNNTRWILFGLIAAILFFTNPTEKDFKHELMKKIEESSGVKQESAFDKFMVGLASFAIESITERKNYILFSMFEIDNTFIKIAVPDSPRLKYFGIGGQIIPLFNSTKPNYLNVDSDEQTPTKDAIAEENTKQNVTRFQFNDDVASEECIATAKKVVSSVENSGEIIKCFDGKNIKGEPMEICPGTLNKGDVLTVSQIWENKDTNTPSLCVHGDSCYPLNDFELAGDCQSVKMTNNNDESYTIISKTINNTASSTPVKNQTSPSFDCSKAKSIPEHMICNDDELSKLDSELAKVYQEAKSRALDADEFKKQTNTAWKWRELNCKDKQCLLDWYGERNLALKRIIQAESLPNASF